MNTCRDYIQIGSSIGLTFNYSSRKQTFEINFKLIYFDVCYRWELRIIQYCDYGSRTMARGRGGDSEERSNPSG